MAEPATVGSDRGTDRDLLEGIKDARIKAVGFLTNRIGEHGRPDGWDQANAWWRAPWALCAAGAPDAAASMMGWIEREALTDEADLRGGSFGGDGPGTPVYLLSPIAIAAALLGHHGTASAVMDRLAHWTDKETGGAYEYQNYREDPLQDMLKTGQLGVSALITGRRDVADGVFGWLRSIWDAQPELPTRLYPSMSGGKLVTQFDENVRLLRVVDYERPKQLYFHSGIAGAFLAGYGDQTGSPEAINLADQYLDLNRKGTEAQFTDESSVQVCKFGWGAAILQIAEPTAARRQWVERMGAWFVDRQNPDGSWAPASFMAPEPGLLDHYWKTAEHLMELAYIEQSLLSS
ncbi:hypothetical protein ABT052_44140 [Streptomyces sp. NPDC002766]|uniref:hypothetical protein n=1 Tax=unclassified Streptomyces TaxID=2593676 RepID=UPI0033189A61